MARQRLTQLQLAARLRWTPGYLQRRITGAVPWSTDDLDEMAAALDVQARHLVTPRALAG
jgi:transcriptional regulator with XRE-family HTH domain